MYGEKNTFEDARTTVTEFLDDFYDESEDNFNQAFLNLERRLQAYFGYEPRDTENGQEPDAECAEYVVYMDGAEWTTCPTEEAARVAVQAYTGEREVWYEKRVKEQE